MYSLHFKVEINEKATRQLFVINCGRFNFDFSWEIQNRTKLKGLRVADGEKLVSVTPESGTVPCSTRKRCQLSFCPPGRLSLAGCDLLLKVCLMWFCYICVLLVEIVMIVEIHVSPLQVNYSSEIHAKRFVTVYRIVCLGNFKRFTAGR